ncbi:hypothetical protein ATY81_08235 [Rhizobium sp. R72]|nr:hypothetical protein ATY81_08235 [Rhizobium sp. R72]OWV97752.1 hypothetical protein ATY80_08235 [Rhizobium sp. R711]
MLEAFICDAVRTPIGRYGGMLATTRIDDLAALPLPDDAPHVNPNGGAIAMGHPLGMSGARLFTTARYQSHRQGGRYALCTRCAGVGQGIAIILERV